jgi:pimeloyl-ACP methyl ester carboxylesterase
VRSLLACVAAVLVLAGCASPLVQEDAAPRSSSATSSPELRTRTLALRDDTRATDPTPATPGSDAVPGRDLPTTLAYAADGTDPMPVVVFTHGLGARPDFYAELLTAWAEAGFLVVAPTFPLTNTDSPQLIQDIVHQPADISFVLDAVLALDDTDGDALQGRIDGEHIAAAGHSAGAATTIGLLSACCLDDRITAAIVLAGAPLEFEPDLVEPGVPTLFVHGTADQVIPVANDRGVFDIAPGPAAFLELAGGEHSPPFDDDTDPAYPAVEAATTDFLRWALTGDDAALAELRAVPDDYPHTDLTDRLAPR